MTDLLAITTDQTLWWITLGAGLVVALVVAGLLEALRRTVVQVRDAVDDLWNMGGRVAQNTSTTHVLETTKARGAELLRELEHHRPPAEGSRT